MKTPNSSRLHSSRLGARLLAAALPLGAIAFGGVAIAACSAGQDSQNTPDGGGMATGTPSGTTSSALVPPTATAVVTTTAVATATATAPVSTAAPSSSAVADSGKPGWKSGEDYCVVDADTHKAGTDDSKTRAPDGCGKDWADAKLRTISGQPSGPYAFDYDAKATKAERAKTKDACCYSVIRPERGRPVRDDGEARKAVTAPSVARRDWQGESAEIFDPSVISSLSEIDRGRLAAAWARDASMEHASIAEFSRVTLSLMALGAPPDLLHRTHEAALDEVRHAEVSFRIASALEGAPIGPGRLAIDPSKPSHGGRVAFARATLEDGCIGETIASLEAARTAELADEKLGAILSAVAEDEAGHAELAYATVAWLLSTASMEERAEITVIVRDLLDRVDAELAAHTAAIEAAPTDALDARFGRISARDAATVRREALANAVRPALAGLIANAFSA